MVYEIQATVNHWPSYDYLMPCKVKGYKVNWKVKYDLVFVFHANFDHMIYLL